MFSATSERTMRSVRWAILAGWLALIALMFFDPLTPRLTEPGSGSPFRIDRAETNADPAVRFACPRYATGTLPSTPVAQRTVDWRGAAPGTCDARCPRIQGRCLVNAPYSMAVRIWWTIIFPFVPLALLLLGHETWRRVCPLGAVSQLPRWFGVQRKAKRLNPETGLVEKKLVLVKPDGWLARNHLYLQFGLLWVGLSLRLIGINSEGWFLGGFLLFACGAALAVGYFYGGKTWCNYICPVSPVQKVYTEPRGLLESRAHVSLRVITGSMCRTTDAQGNEQSACVGCKSPCPDIDLERHYWSELRSSGRRFVYYGYGGLVLGFYTYYRLYSGTWSYYFSGFWTHEEGVLSDAWAPGLFVFDTAIPIPKLVAAPLTLALFILGGYALGVLGERLYGFVSARVGRPLDDETRLHHALSFSTFLTFNVFYTFAGRPNINLMPGPARTVVDLVVMCVSSLWLAQALGRSSRAYERESLGSKLRKQLKKLNLDLSKVLGGRTLDELPPEEVYVLAKTVPDLTEQQKRETYKETLRESLRNGHGDSAAGLKVLDELRDRLGISEAEHGAVLTELGVEDPDLLDPDSRSKQENRLRLESYREALEGLLLDLVQKGVPVGDALQRDSVASEVKRLQAVYSITPEEQSNAVGELFGARSGVMKEAQSLLTRLGVLGARGGAIGALHDDARAGAAAKMLSQLVSNERAGAVHRLLNILSVAGTSQDALDVAEMLARVARPELNVALVEEVADSSGTATTRPFDTNTHWRKRLGMAMIAMLVGRDASELEPVAVAPVTAEEALREMVREREPIAQAVALGALSAVKREDAEREAAALLGEPGGVHWLVRDVAERVRDAASVLGDESTLGRLLRLNEGQLFRHMAPEALAAIAKEAAVRSYARGEELCHQGDASDALLVLSRGGAEVRVDRDDGEPVTVGAVKPGQSLGELGVLTGSVRSATVLATSDGTEAVVIPGERLLATLQGDGKLATALLRTVGERLAQTLARIDAVADQRDAAMAARGREERA